MRSNHLAALAVFLLATPCPATDPSVRVRDPDAILFEGATTIAPQSLRGALYYQLDLALAARPNTKLADYLATLERTLTLGYQHSGFRSAIVKATYDDSREKIVVRIEEGPRRRCGEVEISGFPHAAVADLRKLLTTAEDPDAILWRPDHPVPYDELTAEEIRAQARAVLADAGYFAATVRGAIDDPLNEDQATLAIAVTDLGASAEIGEIRVTGTRRDDPADVLKFLELRTGHPFHGRLGQEIRERLLNSGRYLAVNVPSARNSANSSGRHDVYDVTIEVREFDFAPALDEPFLEEEQALLRLAKWVDRWQAGQCPEDLVLVAERGPIARGQDGGWPAADTPEIARLKLRMVVAPQRGATLTVQALAANEQPVVDWIAASLPQRLLLASPLRNAKLEISGASGKQLRISGETKGKELHDAPDGRPFAFTCNVSWKSTSRADASPLQVELKLQPATLLALLRDEGLKCTVNEGVWEFQRPGFRARIAAESGQPLEMSWNDPESGWNASIAAVRGAFDEQRLAIDQRLAGVKSSYDADDPWRSATCYLLDDLSFALTALDRAGNGDEKWQRQAASYRALRKLVAAWQPPGWHGILSRPDSNDETKAPLFSLPRQLTQLDIDGLLAGDAAARRNVTGFALGVLRGLWPQDGWLWPISRDFTLMYGQGALEPGLDLRSLASAAETGPLGEMFMARLATFGAAEEGLKRLSASGFRRDYQPLLAGDSWLSKLILSFAEAARTLDEDELRALAELVNEESTREVFATLLVTLKARSDRPIAESLAAALDEVWKQRLGEYLRMVLEAQHAAEKSRHVWQYPKTTTPAASPFEPSTPLSDRLKSLEALEEELKAPGSNRSGNKAETPLADQLKPLEKPKNR